MRKGNGAKFGPTVFRIAIALCASVASAQTCNLESKTLQEKLKTPAYLAEKSGWYFSQGLAYLDAGCFQEARQALDKADQVLADEKVGSRDEKERRQFAQSGLRQYIDALELFAQGKREGAKQKLFQLIEGNRTRDVYFRSTLTLASWLAEETDSEEWARIEPHLKELSGRGFEFWQTDFLIRNHQVTIGQGQRAIAELTQQLGNDLPVERKLALDILLAELLFKTGQLAGAGLLTSEIEDQVGVKVLDNSLRLRFLALSATIWNASFQAWGGPYAAKRAQAYAAALTQAQSDQQ
jgi:hypothetical protein